MSRPLILVSNDDGIRAPGLRVLAEFAEEFGEVIVCAPAEERSGFGHAITLRSPLRSHPAPEFAPNWHWLSGTPVDCVYFGVLHLCPRKPDLVLAGINPGYNLGSDVFYSGTVGAAREGLMKGVNALAVSVEAGADPRLALPFARRLIPSLLERGKAGETHLLNLNVPRRGPDGEGAPRDMVVCRLGRRRYDDQVSVRSDLNERHYFWIGGPPLPVAPDDGEDTGAIASGLAAVTPLELDITAPDLDVWAERLDE